MTDVITNVTQARFYAVVVSGPVQGAKLLGLDQMARAQMSSAGFKFDDDLPGNSQFPFQRFQTKTANYQIVAADNLSHFDNLGASGEVDFTLPPIANGYYFAFTGMVAQVLKVISTEGSNIVALNNVSATSVAFQTGGQEIGAGLHIYSNPAGTKWVVENVSAGTATLTLA
jgi:hypothetical protein